MAEKTVVRTLIIKGDAAWVDRTLEHSYIQPDRPYIVSQGEVHEAVREELKGEADRV